MSSVELRYQLLKYVFDSGSLSDDMSPYNLLMVIGFVDEGHTRSAVPVGKYGSTSVKDPTNMRGSWYMIEICSKMVLMLWKDARNAT